MILGSGKWELRSGEKLDVRREKCKITSNIYRLSSSHSPAFTLLEIMIAMAILAISLLALYTSMGNSLQISGQAESMDEASQLARRKMSEIMMSLDEEISRGAFPEEKEEQGTFDKPFEKYKWSYVIKKVEIPVLQPPGEKAVGAVGDSEKSSSGEGPSTTPGLEGAAANMAQMVTKKISESIRELKLTISWGEGEEEDKLVITTHLSKLR